MEWYVCVCERERVRESGCVDGFSGWVGRNVCVVGVWCVVCICARTHSHTGLVEVCA
jgi:hypothetical protein